MPFLFAGCKFSRSALPLGSVLPSVRTVAVSEARGFMWERALWLVGKHTGSMRVSLVPVSAHLDSANDNSELLWFLTEVFAKHPILTQEVVTRDNTEYQQAVKCLVRATNRRNSGTTTQIEVVTEKKKPSVSFLPLSESDRAWEGEIEGCSFL